MKFMLLLVIVSVLIGKTESLRMKRSADWDSVKLNRWLAPRMRRDAPEAMSTPDLYDTMMMNYMVRLMANSATKREANNFMNKRAPKWRW